LELHRIGKFLLVAPRLDELDELLLLGVERVVRRAARARGARGSLHEHCANQERRPGGEHREN
jgi:hypothetical protein